MDRRRDLFFNGDSIMGLNITTEGVKNSDPFCLSIIQGCPPRSDAVCMEREDHRRARAGERLCLSLTQIRRPALFAGKITGWSCPVKN
jgi:hypothetical protein